MKYRTKQFLENCRIEYENKEYNRLHGKKYNVFGNFIIEPDNKGYRFLNKDNNWQLAKNWTEYKNYWRSIKDV